MLANILILFVERNKKIFGLKLKQKGKANLTQKKKENPEKKPCQE